MGDHAEMLHAASAMYNAAGGAAPHGGWWNTAATCSTELAGFSTWSSALAGSYDMAAEGSKAKSATTASSESPGNNSSVTFQEPTTGVADAAGVAVQQPLASFTDWSHLVNGSGVTLHGFLQDGQQHDMSSRTDQLNHINAPSLMNPSSNNLTLQGHHEQGHGHQQLMSNFNLGSELLLSPTSPYGIQWSLLRSLMEPMAATVAKPALRAGFQQYDQYGHQMGMGQASAAGRFALPLQFTNEAAAFWNPSAGFGAPAPEPNQASLGAAKPSPVTNKKTNGQPAFKKPRLETPSPLPTFKVRKEKLGDRVTALQQLVAPFGKTDTASVLHETIEYIKFLHDQVGALSAPYLKQNGHQVPHLKSSSPDKSKDGHGEILLKGRGLCLVPISSTFAVASEVPVDFWTPFGANFR